MAKARMTRREAAIKKLMAAGAMRHDLCVLVKPRGHRLLSRSTKEVDVEISADEADAWVNGATLSLSGGKGSMDLLPGHHMLNYEVRGAPGTTWSVKITAPKEAKDEDGDTFGERGSETGRLPFVINS